MKDKNKFLFLITGMLIGIIVTYIIMDLSEKHQDDVKVHKEITANKDKKDTHEEEEEIVKISASEMKELGIETSSVSPRELANYKNLYGEIVPDPARIAHIVPRFSGLVKRVNKKIGDKIKKGEIIAVIESNESLVKYNVKAATDGVILDMTMTPGEVIGNNNVVKIADLNYVWAELNIYQKDFNEIQVGQTTQINFGDNDKKTGGKIFYVSPVVNEETRTASARVLINNTNGNWKPGMFVSAKVYTEYEPVLKTVTINAIQNFENKKVVFVKHEGGFKPQPVIVGKTNSKYAEILKGLSEGQVYVSKGAFTIKSELLKEAFGGGHGH
ncbi:MAG: efflux RND transporter periplasmic adaptor subunit [Rhodothermaceae bacterium]